MITGKHADMEHRLAQLKNLDRALQYDHYAQEDFGTELEDWRTKMLPQRIARRARDGEATRRYQRARALMVFLMATVAIGCGAGAALLITWATGASPSAGASVA
jgi:hypothetical protein